MKNDNVLGRPRRGERLDQSVRLFLMLVAALATAATLALVSAESTLAQPVTCGNGLLDVGEDCDLTSPAGAFCPPGQICSSCECVFIATTTTPTTSSTTSTTLLNHFQCYEAKREPVTAGPVSLQDQFRTTPSVPLSKPNRLCAPTNKQNEDPGAELDPEHLKSWQDKRKTPKVLNQTIVNQFGSLQLDVTNPAFLLVPASKSLVGPPPPLVAPTDHFQCYKVKRTRGAPKFARIPGVTGLDQFGPYNVDLMRPRYLCAPANKNNGDPTAPSHPEHLLCYKSRNNSPFTRQTVFATDQFGSGPLLIHRRIELCVPSLKNPGATTTSSTIQATTTTSSTGPVTTTSQAATTSSTSTITTSTIVATTSTTSTTLYGSPSRAFVETVRSLLD